MWADRLAEICPGCPWEEEVSEVLLDLYSVMRMQDGGALVPFERLTERQWEILADLKDERALLAEGDHKK